MTTTTNQPRPHDEGGTMVRIRADLGLCQGYANCVIEAEDVFDVDDDGTVVVLRSEVPEAERSRVEAAARSCPVNALTVE